MFSLHLYFVFSEATVENPISQRQDVAKGSRTPTALCPMNGCSFSTSSLYKKKNANVSIQCTSEVNVKGVNRYMMILFYDLKKKTEHLPSPLSEIEWGFLFIQSNSSSSSSMKELRNQVLTLRESPPYLDGGVCVSQGIPGVMFPGAPWWGIALQGPTLKPDLGKVYEGKHLVDGPFKTGLKTRQTY